jgi:hypothetical protein
MKTTLGVLALVVALAVCIGPVLAASTAASRHTCIAAGAIWKWRVKSGHNYNVYPSGTTCSYARSWATRLSYKPLVLKAGTKEIPGGPKGWTCEMRFPFPFKRAWAGSCSKESLAFAWLPLMPTSAIGP